MTGRIWLAIAGLLLAACAGIGDDSKPTMIHAGNVDRLYGRQFELRSMTVEGSPVITHADARMTLAFLPDGHAVGFAAVNQFNNTYTFSPDGKLAWGKGGFVTTRKAGAPELMDKERQYLAALRQVTAAVVSKYGLQMENDDGTTKLVFR